MPQDSAQQGTGYCIAHNWLTLRLWHIFALYPQQRCVGGPTTARADSTLASNMRSWLRLQLS
jgi:hypothetical protein